MRENEQPYELAEQLLRIGMAVGELEHVRSELREILFSHEDAALRDALEKYLEITSARIEKLEESAKARAAVTWLDRQAG